MSIFDAFNPQSLGKLMESLDDSQLEEINQMARQLQNNPEVLSQIFNPQNQTEAEPLDLAEELSLDQELLDQLDGRIVDLLDEAFQLESFIQEDEDSDFSAPALLYLKALLFLLHQKEERLAGNAPSVVPEAPKLFLLLDKEPARAFAKERGFEWPENLASLLLLFWNRIQSDWITESELAYLKTQLLEHHLFDLAWIQD